MNGHKIKKIIVITENDQRVEYDGTEGYCKVVTTNDGALKPREWKTVEAHLVLKEK